LESEQANGLPGFISEGGANAPQRSATQTLVPSGSTSTPLVEPQLRPSGSFAQFSIARYGLGAELIGLSVCAYACAASSAASNASADAEAARTTI
jgi:hypothetical protein